MAPVIIVISGLLALLAAIVLIDFLVHVICWGARSLRTPDLLADLRDAPARPADSRIIT